MKLFLVGLMLASVCYAQNMKVAEKEYSNKNFEKAFKIYEKFAYENNVKAQAMLAHMYIMGEGVSESNEEASYWYEKASRNGDTDAQVELGAMYLYGLAGFDKEKAERFGYTKEDAVIGYLFGNNNMGLNSKLAYYWFLKSAKGGNARGQYFVSGLYNDGNGTKKDLKEAAYWYKKAYNQKEPSAVKYYKENCEENPLVCK